MSVISLPNRCRSRCRMPVRIPNTGPLWSQLMLLGGNRSRPRLRKDAEIDAALTQVRRDRKSVGAGPDYGNFKIWHNHLPSGMRRVIPGYRSNPGNGSRMGMVRFLFEDEYRVFGFFR